MQTTFPMLETTFLFPGPVGNIEVIATPAPETENRQAVTIICHPHPLYGGTMHNKVVSTLARTFKELGLATVRFNFRGVGRTEGVHDQGIGETEDLLALINWVRQVCPNQAIWLAGFSFGGYVAARAATQTNVAQLVTIAPQVSRFIEAALPPITCPWILVQGEQDEIVDPEKVFAWIETVNPKPLVIRMPGAGHFFHGKLVELREKLKQNLAQNF